MLKIGEQQQQYDSDNIVLDRLTHSSQRLQTTILTYDYTWCHKKWCHHLLLVVMICTGAITHSEYKIWDHTQFLRQLLVFKLDVPKVPPLQLHELERSGPKHHLHDSRV